jgi:hypothetical protein
MQITNVMRRRNGLVFAPYRESHVCVHETYRHSSDMLHDRTRTRAGIEKLITSATESTKDTDLVGFKRSQHHLYF